MSERKKNINLKDITDRVAENYLIKKSSEYKIEENSEAVIKEIKRIKKTTMWLAAIYGTLGVLFLYIPQYIWVDTFKNSTYTIPYINFSFKLSILGLIYGFVLVLIEIFFLMRGDLKAVSKISRFYGFRPEKNDIDTRELVAIGMGKDQKKFTEIGINPYQKFSKTGIMVLRVVFMAKAFFSNFIFRILLKKILGRLALRSIIDLASIPIYAAWNAWASAVVARKADMRMMAVKQMKKTGEYFFNKYKDHKEFCSLLYDTFEYIAITKKSFYPSDLIFAKHFLNIFDIQISHEHKLSENYFEKVTALPNDIKIAIGQILVLGFLLDGRIGKFEVGIINKLSKTEIIPYTLEEIKHWTKDYKTGKGFDKMFDYGSDHASSN
jgi:hypothetical protein